MVPNVSARLVGWVKRRESPLAQAAYKAAQALRRAELPWPAPAATVAYEGRRLAKEGWEGVRRASWDQPLFRSRCAIVGEGLRLEAGIPLVTGPVRLELGARVSLHGRTTFASAHGGREPVIRIGEGTSIGCRVQVSAAESVTIGRFVRIAEGCFIADNPGHPTDALRRRTQGVTSDQVKPVVIGDDVWLGTRVVVMAGVHIGAGTIVGAGSVVTSDLPPGVIAAGAPARVVRVIDPSSASSSSASTARPSDPSTLRIVSAG